MQNAEIRDKGKITNLDRYGVENPMQNAEIRDRQQSNLQSLYLNKFSDYTRRVLTTPDLMEELLTKHGSYTALADILGDVIYSTIARHARNMGISHETKVSSGELGIRNLMESLNVNYVSNTRNIIKPHELDCYIPEQKIAIEYNGLYWHCDKFKADDYHQSKYLKCKDLGIQLITIFEDEWLNKPDIVKSIIKTKLGIIDYKYDARKSIIHIVKSPLFKKYHLHGDGNYSICYNLEIGDRIIMSMSFSKSNPARSEKGWAIDRLVTIPNTIVRGGASKLFNAFIKDHPDVMEISTYSDARYGDGNVYMKLGFEYMGLSKPGYWCLINDYTTRLHRFGFTKKKLIQRFGCDPSLSGREMDKLCGISRIYDCGNHRYSWTRN